jgi:hypothetical protein
MNEEILKALVIAISIVESGLDPHAVGDDGRALGMMQIHQCVVTDVNEHMGLTYVHEDALVPEQAEMMFRVYMDRYATKERLEREPTAEDMARIWNGGPYGYKKPCTEAYWKRVKIALDELL